MRKRLTTREAMVYASEMGQKSGKPGCYYWSAIWWRLSAKESKNSPEQLCYSRNQMALYRDMRHRPAHYADNPCGLSDWLWSGL